MGKKKLIDERAVRDMKAAGAVCIELDENTLLTPAARDAAGALRMQILRKKEETVPEPAPEEQAASVDEIDPDLIYRVLDGLISRGLLVLPDEGTAAVRAPETAEAEGIVGLKQMQAMISGLTQAMKGE